jgi:hypothetical protein
MDNTQSDEEKLKAQQLDAMRAAFEFGFRTGEKGDMNLQAALAHFDKTMRD